MQPGSKRTSRVRGAARGGHQVVAERALPRLVQADRLERLAANGPGAAPDHVVIVAAQERYHVAIDAVEHVMGQRGPGGHEPTIAARGPQLRSLQLGRSPHAATRAWAGRRNRRTPDSELSAGSLAVAGPEVMHLLPALAWPGRPPAAGRPPRSVRP